MTEKKVFFQGSSSVNSLIKFNLTWINPKIKREMRKKDRLHKRAVRTKDQHHSVITGKPSNVNVTLCQISLDSHNQYLNDVIGDSLTENPKKVWSYV